ncbi:MAG TPA: hypothetical protein PLB89_05020 [Flavobacteriales bacterium]|nr:hypothetical protein [Flavobacteriales bacterium]
MRISLPGVLRRAAAVCKRSREWKHLDPSLMELLDDLRHLRENKDLETLRSFYEKWADQEQEAALAAKKVEPEITGA